MGQMIGTQLEILHRKNMRKLLYILLLLGSLVQAQFHPSSGAISSGAGAEAPSITNYVFDASSNAYMEDQDATPTMLNGMTDQSFVIRLKFDAAGISTTNRGIIGTTNGFGNSINLEHNLDNKFDGGLRDTGLSTFTNSDIVTDTGWIIITLTFDVSTATFKLYKDNTVIKDIVDGTFTARIDGRAFAIGGSVFSATPLMYLGEISDLQIYDKVLTAGEIASLVTSLSNTATSLVANFAGDKTSSVWTDEAGTYTLTNNGGVTTN